MRKKQRRDLPHIYLTQITLIEQISQSCRKGGRYAQNLPSNATFMSLDEVKVMVEKMSIAPKQADTNARVNACQTIMETDTLGFLLL